MKFYCDKCLSKYSIADEKIRGKILKVRCKNCSHVITVREASAPAPHHAQASADASLDLRQSGELLVQWHYAVNGQSHGPMELDALRQMVFDGLVGDEAYVWNETMAAWKPLADVPELKDSLAHGKQVRPRQKTVGIAKPVSSVRADKTDIGPKRTDAQERASSRRRTAEESSENAAVSALLATAPVTTPEADHAERLFGQDPDQSTETSRRERVDKLREHVRKAPLGASDADEAGDGLHEATVEMSPQHLQALATPDAVRPGRPDDDDILAQQAQLAALLEDAMQEAAGPHAPLQSFTAPEPAPAQALASSEYRRAEMGFGTSPNEGDAGDAVPFLAAPKLRGSQDSPASPAREEVSNSLLLQLDSIKKEGRSRMIVAATVGLVGLVALGGVAYHLLTSEPPRPQLEPAQQALAQPAQKKELVIRTYSNSEQGKIRSGVLELGDQVVPAGEGESEAPPVAAVRTEAKAAVATRGAEKGDSAPVDPFEAAMDGAVAAKSAGPGPTAGLKREADGPAALGVGTSAPDVPQKSGASTDDRFRAIAAVDPSVSQAALIRPDRNRDNRPANLPPGLSSEQAQEGFRHVRHSIGLCRERQMRRGVPLEAKKIYVTIEVANTGRVNTYKVEPDTLKDSEFDRCMQTHLGRWKFAEFAGEPVNIRAPFVMQ